MMEIPFQGDEKISTFSFCCFRNYHYLCGVKPDKDNMTTQAMTQQIAEYFKTQPVLKAWIFGSFARGEQTAASDIDILILPEKSVGLFKLSGMHLDLQDLLHIDVDLVTVKGLMPFARESADRDKILIYERAS